MYIKIPVYENENIGYNHLYSDKVMSSHLTVETVDAPYDIIVYKYTQYQYLDQVVAVSFKYMGKIYNTNVAIPGKNTVAWMPQDYVNYILNMLEKQTQDIFYHPKVLEYFLNKVNGILASGASSDGIKVTELPPPPGGKIPYEGMYFSGDIPLKASKLPGMEAMVDYPCDCLGVYSLYFVVQHLNDKHRWAREKIADWIDELHDSGVINAEFEPWKEGEENEQD